MTPDQLCKSGKEHGQQVALFAWAAMAQLYGVAAANDDRSYTVKGHAGRTQSLAVGSINTYSCIPITQLKWMHAIHNQGHGDKIRGGIAKAEGVKSGVADIFLPVVMPKLDTGEYKDYSGLYIEMKVGKNKTSSNQDEFLEYAANQGYKTAVCYTWREARDVILEYLGIK